MSKDTFPIDILHYLHPQMLWVENKATGAFEQIGIYGLVPKLPLLTISSYEYETGDTKRGHAQKWAAGAMVIMMNHIKESDSVLFSTKHVIDTITIFRSSKMLYGEITIIKRNGARVKASELLISASFASYEEQLFHEKVKHNSTEIVDPCQHYQVVAAIEKALDGDIQMRAEYTPVKPYVAPLTVSNVQKLAIAEESALPKPDGGIHPTLKYIPKGTGLGLKTKTGGDLLSNDGVPKFKAPHVTQGKIFNDIMKCTKCASSTKTTFGPPEIVNKLITNKKVTKTTCKCCKTDIGDLNANGHNPSTTGGTETFTSKRLARRMALAKAAALNNQSDVSKTNSHNDREADNERQHIKQPDLKSEFIKLANPSNTLQDAKRLSGTKPIVSTKYDLESTQSDPIGGRLQHTPELNSTDTGSYDVFEKLLSPVVMLHSRNYKNRPAIPEAMNNHIWQKEDLSRRVNSMSLNQPMMVQTISWPYILRGSSFFMVSPPVSGKTLGYIPPVCALVMEYKTMDLPSTQGPICIVVCATATGAINVEKKCVKFLQNGGRVLACYPGVDEKEIQILLLNGCDIFVCTPCALIRLLHANLGLDLERMVMCVLDEADRLNNVYLEEIEAFILKTNEMLSKRVFESKQIQYVVASETWCDFMKPLVKMAVEPIICIAAYEQCVIYSMAPTTVDLVHSNDKLKVALEFLEDMDKRRKGVIVCRTDSEVKTVATALRGLNYTVLSADSEMTIETLFTLSKDWYRPGAYAGNNVILVCCDSNLMHLNITNAHCLLHYSMPSLFSTFCRRFSVLADNYASIFNTNRLDDDNVKIKILIDENDKEVLPKVVRFIRRCKQNIPDSFDGVCHDVLLERDRAKAKKLTPVCNDLLTFGQCSYFWRCNERHNLCEEYDKPSDLLPTRGVITFRVINFDTAATYCSILTSNTVDGKTVKYPSNYNSLTLDMAMSFDAKDENSNSGIFEVGEIYGFVLKPKTYVRCQFIKFLDEKPRLIRKCLIKLIDEQNWKVTSVDNLFGLPKRLKELKSYCALVKLGGLQPADKDVTFSDEAKVYLKKITNALPSVFMRANVVACIGSTVIVDDMEVWQDLSTKGSLFRYNVKETLLNFNITKNTEYFDKLRSLVSQMHKMKFSHSSDVNIPKEIVTKEPPSPWAHNSEVNIPKEIVTKEPPSPSAHNSEVNIPKEVVTKEPPSPWVHNSEVNNPKEIVTKDPLTTSWAHNSEVNIPKEIVKKEPPSPWAHNSEVNIPKEIVKKEPPSPWAHNSDVNIPKEIVKKVPPTPSWAHLDEAVEMVLFSFAESPDKFYIRLGKFEESLGILTDDIQNYITNNDIQPLSTFNVGDVVLAKFPDDSLYYRSIIKEIFDNKIRCFFVDHGDEKTIEACYIADIPIKFINQLPFQAIECRLFGVKPAGENWTELSTDFFYDFCMLDGSDLSKDVSVKYCQIGIAEGTGGLKYAVVLMDPNADDKILSEEMIAANLARENEDESAILRHMQLHKRLNEIVLTSSTSDESQISGSFLDSDVRGDIDLNVEIIKKDTSSEISDLNPVPTKEIGSANIPGSSESTISGDWDVELPAELLKCFGFNGVPPITSDADSIESFSSLTMKPSARIQEIVTDDVSLVKNDFSAFTNASSSGELRKPKLFWYQNNTYILIKVHLIGVEQYDIDIGQRSVKFSSVVQNTNYGFDLDLFGYLDTEKCAHAVKGLYVQVKLEKVVKKKWVSLLRDDIKRNWIVYDPDQIQGDDTDEDDEADKWHMVNRKQFEDADDGSENSFESIDSFEAAKWV